VSVLAELAASQATHGGILDRHGEDLVDGVQLEVFDVPVNVPWVLSVIATPD
jgi:hypothetical protein